MGIFFLENGSYNGKPVIVISYELDNNFLSKNIKDYIRVVKKGKLYLGRFNYCVGDRFIFLGYFSLAKK